MQSYNKIIETLRYKTPEELTKYLVQRLEESEAILPPELSSRKSVEKSDKEAAGFRQIIQNVNEEFGTAAYNSEEDEERISSIDSIDNLELPQIIRLLFSSAGLRECMYLMGCCSVVEFIKTVQGSAPPKSLCCKVLNSERVYHCIDCQNDESSVICMDCFEPEKHVGHRYFISTASGMCDCGDENALKSSGFCSRHTGLNPKDDMRKYYPACYVETTRPVLCAMCRYAIVHICDCKKYDNVRSVLLAMYILAKKLGYGFGSMLGDAICQEHPDLVPGVKMGAPLLRFAYEVRGHDFDRSLLWDIAFYNRLIPDATKIFVNKILFELIGIFDFRSKFTAMFIRMHRWCCMWLSGIYPGKAIDEFKSEGLDFEEETEDDEYEDSIDNEGEESSNFEGFSVQLISSKGACGEMIDKLSFFVRIFDTLHEIFARCLAEDVGGAPGEGGNTLPFIDIFETNSSLLSVLERMCSDIRYALQQTDWNGVNAFFRSSSSNAIISSMYSAISLFHGLWPNKLSIVEYIDVGKAFVSDMFLMLIALHSPLKDMLNGFEILSIAEKEHVTGRVLAEMWHQMCDVHTSYIDCPRIEIETGDGAKLSVVDYDITTKGASLVTTLNVFTIKFLMEALNDFDSLDSLFRTANAMIKKSEYADKEITPESFAQAFLEAPLRALAYSSQIEAGHWVRNGEALFILNQFFRRHSGVSTFFCLNDLCSLQLCAAILPRDLFVATLLERFGVGTTHPAALKFSPVRPAVVYGALDMLLNVALENAYLPRTDPVAAARHTMVQFLALLPSFTYQEGFDVCPPHCEKYYESIIDDITEKVNGKYRLIDSLWDTEITPYFFFHGSNNIGVLVENYEVHLKRNKRPEQSLPCPKISSAPAHPLFKNLPGLLASRPLHMHIAQALCTPKFIDYDNDGKPSKEPPESQIYVLPCLHIIYLCLTSAIVCPSPSDLDPVIESALSDFGGMCTVAAICKIYHKYKENEALAASILRLLAARNPACRTAAEKAFEALGVSFEFDVTPEETPAAQKKRKENRKKQQSSALSKLRAKQLAYLQKVKSDDDKVTESDYGNSANNGKDDDSVDSCVCVFCHGHEGKLGWIGYAQKSDLLCRIDEVSQDSLTLGNSLPTFDEDNTKSALEFLATGMRNGIYIQLCKHRAHRECLGKYLSSGDHAHSGSLDKKALQYSCPACTRISNIFIADDSVDDMALYIPMCFMENGDEVVRFNQKLFYMLCRALGYTSASYELAARNTGTMAAYLTQERRDLLSIVLKNARIASADFKGGNDDDDDDDVHDIPELLDALIDREPNKVLERVNDRTLFTFDTFTVFVMYLAVLGETERVDKAFILNLLIAEMCKVRAAIVSSSHQQEQEQSSAENVITMRQIVKYCVPFLRRVLTLLASTQEEYKDILADIGDEYDFYVLVALLRLPRLPIVSSSFVDTDVNEVLAAPGCNVASEFFSFLETSDRYYVSKTSPAGKENNFKLVFSTAKPFHISVLEPSIEKMIVGYSKTVCPRCGTHPKYPCVCLICGKFVCAFDCCNSECNRHADECTKTHGMFYSIYSNFLIFFRSDRKVGTIYDSPYVDV